MAPKPRLSISLPRNSTFHNATAPHTPAVEPEVDITEPPPPPKQTFKIRRRRVADNDATLIPAPMSDADSGALPTFQMTQAHDTHASSPALQPALSPLYLAPVQSCMPPLSPPKTPLSQTHTYDVGGDSNEWSLIHKHSLPRPLSACSSFSGSSSSSFGSSSNSYPSFGGSCTSPDSDVADPFSHAVLKTNDNPWSLPTAAHSPSSKRHKAHRHPRWTAEMDKHLWLIYVLHIQDPRITPFKMLPGTAPPLGVCHRVARDAKRAWKSHQADAPNPEDRSLTPTVPFTRAESLDALMTDQRAGSVTPKAEQPKPAMKWPRSEGATRKRLRYLCKRKPSLSAHYQRLLHTRSPSPFQSSSPPSRSDSQSCAFSSRSMNVSLAAATAPSMQADGLLAQLSSDAPELPEVPEERGAPRVSRAPAVQRPEGWYQRIGRARAHQKSQSLQLGLGLDRTWGPSTSVLASPFKPMALPNDTNGTQSLGRNFSRKPDDPTPLRSPLELHAPVPTARSLKRRFRLDEDGPSQVTTLQDLFAGHGESNSRPARERAFSLSAMGDGTRSLSSFFSPPPASDFTMAETEEPNPSAYHLAPPEAARRLGSPFGGAPSNTHYNTFPRHFAPFGSDTPSRTLEDRFRQLAAQRQ